MLWQYGCLSIVRPDKYRAVCGVSASRFSFVCTDVLVLVCCVCAVICCWQYLFRIVLRFLKTIGRHVMADVIKCIKLLHDDYKMLIFVVCILL